PPRTAVELDDTLLNQFVLVDPRLEGVRDDLEAFQRARFAELGEVPTAANLRANFAALRDIAGRVTAGAALAAADMERWRKQLDRQQRPRDDPTLLTRERTTYETLRKTLPETADDLKKAVAMLDQHAKAVAEGNRKDSWEAVTQDAKTVLAVLDGVIAVQTQA